MKRRYILTALLALGALTVTGGYASAESSTLDGYDRAAEAAKTQKALGVAEDSLAKTDPEYVAVRDKYLYGDIAQQAKITPKERTLVQLSVLTADHDSDQIKGKVGEALAAGATPLEVRETLYHIAPYIGFAKVSTALRLADEVFTEKGISLPLPTQGTTNDKDRFEKGLKFQRDTYGRDHIDTMRASVPESEKHLQDDLSAFCFGDTYTRGTLDLKTREMVTMAAIGTLGIEMPFKAHVMGTLSAGATEDEVVGVMTAMNPYVGFPRTLWMMGIVNDCLKAKKQ